MMIQGEEIFFVDYRKDDSKVILYAPLRSYLALITKDLMRSLTADSSSEARDAFVSRLKDRKLINIQNIADYIQNSLPELSLALTDDCNLKCVYCIASAGDAHKRVSMRKDFVEFVIRRYFEHVPQNAERVYICIAGGGEPAIDIDLLQLCVDKAREYGGKRGVASISFSMPTNGVYGRSTREYILNNIDDILLSLDGPDYIHNVHRPSKNGKGSFDTVFETARFFYSNKAKLTFRVTVSKQSLPHLRAIADFFIEYFPNTFVFLEPLIPHGRGSRSSVETPNFRSFGDGIIDILDYTKGKPIKIRNSVLTAYDSVRPIYCSSVAIPNWTVSVDGEVYCCLRDGSPDVFKFGSFDLSGQTISLEPDKIAAIRKMNVFNYDECVDCFSKYHCAGDCPDRRLSYRLGCDVIRKVGGHILNDRISS